MRNIVRNKQFGDITKGILLEKYTINAMKMRKQKMFSRIMINRIKIVKFNINPYDIKYKDFKVNYLNLNSEQENINLFSCLLEEEQFESILTIIENNPNSIVYITKSKVNINFLQKYFNTHKVINHNFLLVVSHILINDKNIYTHIVGNPSISKQFINYIDEMYNEISMGKEQKIESLLFLIFAFLYHMDNSELHNYIHLLNKVILFILPSLNKSYIDDIYDILLIFSNAPKTQSVFLSNYQIIFNNPLSILQFEILSNISIDSFYNKAIVLGLIKQYASAILQHQHNQREIIDILISFTNISSNSQIIEEVLKDEVILKLIIQIIGTMFDSKDDEVLLESSNLLYNILSNVSLRNCINNLTKSNVHLKVALCLKQFDHITPNNSIIDLISNCIDIIDMFINYGERINTVKVNFIKLELENCEIDKILEKIHYNKEININICVKAKELLDKYWNWKKEEEIFNFLNL